ncbi:hypothetical protein Y1Q_0003181 [Alligator mississippiensis]|uniref:Uncharacterized protein n=1 Tax=Alligator mississippiensis TaxID=8496 RepID=A0A151MDR9_ALLMI|nr:hypothetical protein Y1Q_0003181 [Alligator mississippiensis]
MADAPAWSETPRGPSEEQHDIHQWVRWTGNRLNPLPEGDFPAAAGTIKSPWLHPLGPGNHLEPVVAQGTDSTRSS